MPDYNLIREIQDFESLIDYLSYELEWPIDVDDLEDITFDYEPEEFGLEEAHIVKTNSIKQLRPLTLNQPWGIFYIEFESKRLPVVVLRRILRALVRKKRDSAAQADLPAWNLNDLLFISTLGEYEHRGISFAHFRDSGDGQPQLRTFSWDQRETHFYYLRNLNLESLRWPQDDNDSEAWREQWSNAFTTVHRWTIGTSKDLSLELAQLARRTRELVHEVYKYELKTGPLHHLYESFRTALVHDLDLDGFADMVAQTIAYGLFSARATGEAVLGLAHLEAMVPNTNPFLRELFAEFTRISGYKRHQIDFDELGVSELVELLNDTDMESVLRDFGRQTGGGVEDPVIHFYELFLNEYDKQQKVQRGVFYTPKPVVSFIVHSVHELLRTEFGLEDGLADTTTWGEMINRNKALKLPEGTSPDEPFVQILDPATGTGTFLETVIDVIYENMTAKWRRERKSSSQVQEAWNEYVPKHLLPRLHGFELMMAPYAVAHMKLGLKLGQTGYDFKAGERLRIYLTNTLEPPSKGKPQLRLIPEFLSHEAEAADEVKQKTPITVIIGNPPYSGISANMGNWIKNLIESYKYVDGTHFGEKKHWLQDDYVKFIRFAQWKIDQVGEGVLGFITNHSYLDNPTFRGMRQSLMNSFNDICVLDLHGSSLKKEKSPDKSKDENVFDIQQGVAITSFVETKKEKGCKVYHSEMWGLRSEKYDWLLETKYDKKNYGDKLNPTSPYYFFVPRKEKDREIYEKYRKITDIFPINGTGILTARDHFVIDFNRKILTERIVKFRNPNFSDEFIKEELNLKENYMWRVSKAREELAAIYNWEKYFTKILYRPFDIRHIYFHDSIVWRTRKKVMYHMLAGGNLAFHVCRQIVSEVWQHILATNQITDDCYVSNKTRERGYTLPLYLYSTEVATQKSLIALRHPNLNPTFLKTLSEKLTLPQTQPHNLPEGITPEDILHYAYAVFHSPTYRERYTEFLKIDFPRLPLTNDLDLFRILCAKGAELVALHLMESSQLDNFITTFHDSGDRQITKVGETRKTLVKSHDGKGRLYINRTAYFDNVPLDVWEFHIGGYQVCYKWLADRKKAKRSLSDEDIVHYQRIIVALKETIRLMAEIDEVIDAHGGWPLPGSTSG